MRYELTQNIAAMAMILSFRHSFLKQSILNFPIPRFIRAYSFDASIILKVTDIFLDCSRAYAKNVCKLRWRDIRVVPDFRNHPYPIWREPCIIFIHNFIPNHVDPIEGNRDHNGVLVEGNRLQPVCFNNLRDSSSRFLADMELKEYFRQLFVYRDGFPGEESLHRLGRSQRSSR